MKIEINNSNKLTSYRAIELVRGQSTLEMLIALSVLILCVSAAILVSFGSQSTSVDSETSGEAIYKAQAQLEEARALSRGNFAGVSSYTTSTTSTISYAGQLSVQDLTPCLKQVTSTITWTTEKLRPQKITLSSELGDVSGTIAMGGDCDTSPPLGDWKYPISLASANFYPGKPKGVDVLNKIVYLGGD